MCLRGKATGTRQHLQAYVCDAAIHRVGHDMGQPTRRLFRAEVFIDCIQKRQLFEPLLHWCRPTTATTVHAAAAGLICEG